MLQLPQSRKFCRSGWRGLGCGCPRERAGGWKREWKCPKLWERWWHLRPGKLRGRIATGGSSRSEPLSFFLGIGSSFHPMELPDMAQLRLWMDPRPANNSREDGSISKLDGSQSPPQGCTLGTASLHPQPPRIGASHVCSPRWRPHPSERFQPSQGEIPAFQGEVPAIPVSFQPSQ